MSEFTVTIEPYYSNWQGNGERPIWHTHLEASSTDEAVEFGKKLRDANGHALHRAVKMTADPRFM
ncbi:hypothetical protein N2600_28235 (plasmid) [Rhizobium sp. WSM1274]|uniref:hypothetical protein n=1 Tax=Rhizobium sp. WSM1274 TaxID=3138254 RepID=UPI0021A4025E|nr:hypothetical protein [Rhizobium leguminosarum]UWU31875.1 hypothetical protein N2600_28235 [Rhizobium leguminosarum bv. viciae]